jgi:catechol-2,3-dioxygenase
MEQQINRLVNDFEAGAITRRQLIGRLTALAVTAGIGGTAAAQRTEASTFKAVNLNHLALRCTDLPRSRDWYVKHLGMSVSRDSANSCFLNFDHGFLALFKDDTAGMHHYCYSIEDYDVERAVETLNANNLNPRREGNRVYFPDPDGNTVQLAAIEHTA